MGILLHQQVSVVKGYHHRTLGQIPLARKEVRHCGYAYSGVSFLHRELHLSAKLVDSYPGARFGAGFTRTVVRENGDVRGWRQV